MKTLRTLTIACMVSTMALGSAFAQTTTTAPAATTYTPSVGQPGKDVVWVPTPQALVDRMMIMGGIEKGTRVYDLGSGDGRTVITAAKLGANAHGIEFNPDMVELSKRNATEAGVTENATFAQGDIFESDFSDAEVVTLFLLPSLNLKLRPILLDMEPGVRVVSNTFDMGEWQADEEVAAGGDCENYCNAYRWTIPAKVAGNWQVGDGQLALEQTFQMLSGTMTQDGKSVPISNAKMDGRTITFTAGDATYTGEVGADNTITGSISGGGDWSATRS